MRGSNSSPWEGDCRSPPSILVEAGSIFLYNSGRNYRSLLNHASLLRMNLSTLDFGVLSGWYRGSYEGFSALAVVKNYIPIYAPPGQYHRLERLGFKVIPVSRPTRPSKDIHVIPVGCGGGSCRALLVVVESHRGSIILVSYDKPLNIDLENLTRYSGMKPLILIAGFPINKDLASSIIEEIKGYLCLVGCVDEEVIEGLIKRFPGRVCKAYPGASILVA